MMPFEDKDQLTPANAALTDVQLRDNCWRMERNACIGIDARCKAAEKYRHNKTLMLEHLRGVLLKRSTRTVTLDSGGEKGLVATQDIPAGSILSLYFGTICRDDGYSELPSKDRAIGCSLELKRTTFPYDLILQSWVIGKLEGVQTAMATMNHAYTRDVLRQKYVFIDERDWDKVASANVGRDWLKWTLVKDGMHYEVQSNCWISQRDIKVGEALLWPYDTEPEGVIRLLYRKKHPQETYWGSRGLIPLLFDRTRNFFDPQKYFPTEFHCQVMVKVTHHPGGSSFAKSIPITIPYKLVPALMGADEERQEHALTQLRNKHLSPKLGSPEGIELVIENVQGALKATGFINERSLALMKQRETHSPAKHLISILIAFSAYLTSNALLNRSDQDNSHRFFSTASLGSLIIGLATLLFLNKIVFNDQSHADHRQHSYDR